MGEIVGIGLATFAIAKSVSCLGEPKGPLAARRTLAATLVSIELGQVAKRLDHASGIIQNDDRTGARHGSSLLQRIKIVGQVEQRHIHLGHLAVGPLAVQLKDLAGLQNLRGGTARNDGLQGTTRLESAAEVGVKDQFAQSDPSDLNLVVTRLLHIAAQTDDAGAGVVGRAQLGVLGRPHEHDVLHVTQRLDVVHDGRAHVEPQDRREVRRLDPGVSPLAFEGFDQTGFLATNIGAGTAMHVNLQIVTRAQNILSQKTRCPGFLKCLIQQLGRNRHLTPDVDVGQLYVVGPAREDHPLDQLVRILVEDLTILEGARFGLVGVANQIDRLTAAAVHEAPLKAGRETRATTTAQP